MSWGTPSTQTAGQPATSGWANVIGGDLIQVNTILPMVSGGLTGAIASGRFVGFTNGNSPSTGTFLVGDFAFDISASNPRIWACTLGGSPGSWASIGAAVPTGTVVAYTSAVTDPAGWLLCDGRAASRTTYAALYSLLIAVGGTNPYGVGDGSTTFNLPDLRGRTIFGADNFGTGVGAASRFTANNTLGAAAQGEFAHTLSIAEQATHAHVVTVSDTHAHTLTLISRNGSAATTQATYGGDSPSGTVESANTSGTAVGSITASDSSVGGGTSHNIIPLSQIVNWIIKT